LQPAEVAEEFMVVAASLTVTAPGVQAGHMGVAQVAAVLIPEAETLLLFLGVSMLHRAVPKVAGEVEVH
jgi:hypothetical protein